MTKTKGTALRAIGVLEFILIEGIAGLMGCVNFVAMFAMNSKPSKVFGSWGNAFFTCVGLNFLFMLAGLILFIIILKSLKKNGTGAKIGTILNLLLLAGVIGLNAYILLVL